LTGVLFVLAASVASAPVMFVWLTLVLIVLLLITVYDYYHFIIPDEMTIALTTLTAGWLVYQWWFEIITSVTLLWTVGAALAGAGFFFSLWAISRGRWLGFGDVKLAIPLGLWVGPVGVFSFIVGSFWIGAAISLVIVGWQKYRRGKQRLHLSAETLTMKSAVPFAPFMIAGALLVYFTTFNVLSLFSFA
jgi:prepilin signal peptidase PulO-like enzyme (type II secretory pathway)